MPNRFNDRENGESSYFPGRRRERDRPFPERNFQSRPHERRGWESNENEEHARRGQDIHESYGGYSGEEYERGVYGNESPGQRHSECEQGPFFGKGPKNYRRSDQRIEEDINERLTQHPFIDATNIEVHVHNGEVLLSGSADDRNAKRIAEDIVDSVSGVKEVQNQIRFNKKF